jgi:hypothetical protein
MAKLDDFVVGVFVLITGYLLQDVRYWVRRKLKAKRNKKNDSR